MSKTKSAKATPTIATAPSRETPKAALTAGSAWAHVALTADTDWLEVYAANDVYLAFSASSSNPAQFGRRLIAGVTHRIYAGGKTWLHYRQVSAGGTLEYTEFGD